MYNNNVILCPSEGKILIKATFSSLIDLTGLVYKIVEYKGARYILTHLNDLICRQLAKGGVNVQTGICYDYNWSGKFTPKDHQKITADFFVKYPRSFCFNDIGTGKTLSALWAADYLMTQGLVDRVLIISTVSTMDLVWGDTLFHHFPHRKYQILHGEKKKRLEKLAIPADFYIINHDGIKVVNTELRDAKGLDLIIVDEGSVFRNKATNRWKALFAIAHTETKRGCWWLTGSPMPNAPTDIWAQARILNPSTVSKYFSRFREETMVKLNQFQWVPRKGWQDMVYSGLKPSIRFNRDECLDLPPVTTFDHKLEMTKDQAHAYNTMQDTFTLEVANQTIDAVNELSKITKLVQISAGAIYDSEGTHHKLDVTPKFSALTDVFEEVGDKLILFVPFKHSIKIITDWLESLSQNKSWQNYGVVHGGVNKAKRDLIFDDFQNGTLKLIIAHPAAMAHGLTLTAANTIVWWSPVDSYEIYEQANGRITRDGQTRKQYIKRFICSPIEKKIYKRLENKQSMQGLLLEMITGNPTVVD